MTECSKQSGSIPTCKHCIEFLMAYLDGELPASEKATFDAHMAACPPCHEYLRSYVASVKLCGQQRRGGSVPEMPEEMVRAILAAREAGGSGSSGA
jgi:anti-sigma factor RsiW